MIDTQELPRLGEALEERGFSEQEAYAPEPETEERRNVSPWLASAAAFLATAGAGWMLGGVFGGAFPRFVGVMSALLGAGMVAVSHKTRTPVLLQFLILPLAVIGGALLVAPDATGGTANLPNLVVEALRSGGLSSPPVPFDPGWRFLMVVLVSSVAVTGASGALATNRPRLAVFLPAPVTVAGILVQPPGGELVSILPALVATVGGLAVAFGADLATQGTTGGEFEIRRFVKAGGILGGLIALMVVASQMGFLFPDTESTDVIPPQRPKTSPAEKDRVIFTVESPVAMPWRLGVFDVYDENAWMTPPFDPQRFEDVPPSGRIAKGTSGYTATFRIDDLSGRNIPVAPNALAVKGRLRTPQHDPRTGSLRVGGRPRSGTTYTIQAAAPPDAGVLSNAPPPRKAMERFMRAPAAPPDVQTLLSQIPPDVPAYERLQFVRTKFYEAVIAAGPGNPKDVPPSRVADMLAGKEGSPYEITSAEALLARWAGVPSRIGYGYYGGELKDGKLEFRPKHGAMWLEAYFEGQGWVPIVGRPPRAKASLSQKPKNDEPNIKPTEELGAVVYVPIRLQRITLLYLLVQYWIAKAAPVAFAILVVCVFYTGLLKVARKIRRRAWAGSLGAQERIAATYAEFRDVAIDLNIGHPTMTPIEFLDAISEDSDHTQLAWLVTRALWGDLRRDVRSDDAEQAELWSKTLRHRLLSGQSPLMRVLAFASRASLKAPYDPDIPNLWWPFSPRREFVRLVLRVVRLPRFKRRPKVAVAT